MTAILELKHGTKEYRGIPALKAVTFTLERGEVHALLGENGAGKSTLTKMLAGVVSPTSGQVLIDGKPVELTSPADALRKGIAMVYQETSLVPSLTVAQNLYLGDARWFNRLRGIYIAAQQFLQSLNFPVDPAALVSSLGAGQKQMVEIARAVHHKARVIMSLIGVAFAVTVMAGIVKSRCASALPCSASRFASSSFITGSASEKPRSRNASMSAWIPLSWSAGPELKAPAMVFQVAEIRCIESERILVLRISRSSPAVATGAPVFATSVLNCWLATFK